jgi:hypothetical protein
MFKALYARTIILIGFSFAAIILVFALCRYWIPKQEETKMLVDNYNLHVAEIGKKKQVVKKKENAIKAVQEAERRWASFVDTHTPLDVTPSGGININVNAYQLLLDTKRFRNSVQRALNAQIKSGGVRVLECPRIPGVTDDEAPNSILASYYNYPAVPFPVVIYDLGQVRVQGTYEQICANVRAWKNMPRYLAVTHNLAITGTAPTLTATYDLSMVGYVRYDGVYAPVPDGGAPAGGAGGGAAAGGGRAGGPAGIPLASMSSGAGPDGGGR